MWGGFCMCGDEGDSLLCKLKAEPESSIIHYPVLPG